MQIILNGKSHQTTAPTVAALMQELGLPARGIAVAINNEVVRGQDHEHCHLHENDVVEVIRAVQGG